MVNNTHHIREQLSDQEDSIDRLAAEDGEFRAMCDDYDACVDALRYWAGSVASGAEARVGEYRDLIEGLYEEITHTLDKYTKRRHQ